MTTIDWTIIYLCFGILVEEGCHCVAIHHGKTRSPYTIAAIVLFWLPFVLVAVVIYGTTKLYRWISQ